MKFAQTLSVQTIGGLSQIDRLVASAAYARHDTHARTVKQINAPVAFPKTPTAEAKSCSFHGYGYSLFLLRYCRLFVSLIAPPGKSRGLFFFLFSLPTMSDFILTLSLFTGQSDTLRRFPLSVFIIRRVNQLDNYGFV